MGVLVGTSLVVIIPEGIEAVYSANVPMHTRDGRSIHSRRDIVNPTFAEAVAALPGPVVPDPAVFSLVPRTEMTGSEAVNALPGPVIPAGFPDTPDLESFPTVTDDTTGEFDVAAAQGDGTVPPGSSTPVPPKDQPAHEDDDHHNETSPPTFFIGFSLITGFILMYLIDKLPQHATSTLSTPTTRHISLNNLSSDDIDDESQTESFLHSLTPSPKQSRSLATTTGLVIHAAADGIAMGASASGSDDKLSLIIFLAIMIHKAPAAFGLTSVLLKQGLSKRAARAHLTVFSLAAPVGALSTWLLVRILGGGEVRENSTWWTGMLLLFSAGTFLYVAMHAMQDDASAHDHSTMNGYGEGGNGGAVKRGKGSIRDTVASVVGMLIPLATQIGHHH